MTDETDIDPAPPRVTGSPESIWLVYGDIDSDATHSECHEVMWCEDGQYASDVKYVREDLFDVQAAKIERLRFALAEIHAEFVHGSRKLYSTPDYALDRIRATAANALKGT